MPQNPCPLRDGLGDGDDEDKDDGDDDVHDDDVDDDDVDDDDEAGEMEIEEVDVDDDLLSTILTYPYNNTYSKYLFYLSSPGVG